MRTSYSRRRGDYGYDIEVHEATAPRGTAEQFYARVVNLVRQDSGETVSINAELQDAYGATRDVAVSRIETALAAWVKDQTRPKLSHARHGTSARSDRLARVELMLLKLCATSDHLHTVATLAQERADRRIAETKAITARAQVRGTKPGKKR
jgi:hypothetical protein